MTVSELWKLCASCEPGACSRIQLSFCNDSHTLIRWRSHEPFRTVILTPFSREDAVRSYLPRHMRSSRQGCHGIGSDTKDAQSERQESIVDTPDFADGSYSYKIKEGDTLTSIANKFKVPLRSIAILNEIADIDYVPAGKWLLIPHVCMKTSEAGPEIHHPLNLVEDQKGESSSTAQVKGTFSLAPACSAAPLFQARHVKLALSFLLLLAVFVLVKKYISGLGPKQHDERIQCQIEREVEGVHHKPIVKRWQCILDDDRKVNEEEGTLSADGRAALDTEEENLRQTYAQLESAYAKFLADSGLSKTGYWRGGVPPALEEK